MQSNKIISSFNQQRGKLLSIAAHASLLILLFGGFHAGPKIAPFRLPGTKQGVTILTYYSPGSLQSTTRTTSHQKVEKKITPTTDTHKITAPEIAKAAAPKAEAGTGSSAESGLGEGDITIALETYFPYPKPDLSSLPHGTEGDVILDAVVDENGKITTLTLLKGLGPSIDKSVIATVQQWSYTPAKRNGIPVPSERELHFHYQRG